MQIYPKYIKYTEINRIDDIFRFVDMIRNLAVGGKRQLSPGGTTLVVSENVVDLILRYTFITVVFFPVLAEHQIGIDGNLSRRQSETESLVRHGEKV